MSNTYDVKLNGMDEPICRVQCGPKLLSAIVKFYLEEKDSEGFHVAKEIKIQRLVEE